MHHPNKTATLDKGDVEKDPMADENFKMRYELGELSDDELMLLGEDDLTQYLNDGKFKDEL